MMVAFKWPLPRIFTRLLIVAALLVFALSVHLLIQSTYVRHNPQQLLATPPIVVHGKKIHEAPKPEYPLEPFPDSPLQPPENQTDIDRPWLAAILSTAAEVDRRMLIRSSWMRLYRNVPYDTMFVVANPEPKWKESIIYENRTFGDIIILDKIPDDDVTAHTTKTFEFYKWLLGSGRKYEFVTRLDADIWLNARGFYDKFLAPRISRWDGPAKSTVKQTVIGELYYDKKSDLVFPHHSMYTLTWDMVELLARLQDKFHLVTGEDMAIALLLLRDKQKPTFVNFRGREKFDFDEDDVRGDGTAWARENTRPDAIKHAVTDDAIVIQNIKDSDSWQRVAACFDEKGIKGRPEMTVAEKSPSLFMRFRDLWHRFWPDTRFRTVPESLFKKQDNENIWICDGLWNMGAMRDGTYHDL